MINRRWIDVAIAGCTMLALLSVTTMLPIKVEAQMLPSEADDRSEELPQSQSEVLSQSENTGSGNAESGESSPNSAVDGPSQQNRSPSSLSSALSTLRQQFERDELPLGSRGPQCAYSPGLVGETDTIWSDRPLFLWRSSGQAIRLYDYESGNLLWQREVETGTEAVLYDGDPLIPGTLYRWELTHPDASDFKATFAVMEEAARNELRAELEGRQMKWEAAGLSEPELAVERAQFFGDRRLWSDALKELHAVRYAAEVDDTVKEISIYLCGALESDLQAAVE